MARSLLNKLNTPNALRQALVFFTMLLLPSTAWAGDPIISTFTGYDATTSTITFGSGSTGEWSLYGDVTGVLGSYNNNTDKGLQITNSEGSYQSSFKLISNFTVSGTIAKDATLCTINMGYSDPSNTSGSISIKYDPSGSQYTQEISTLQNGLTNGDNTLIITNIPMGGNEPPSVTFENNHLIIELNNLTPGSGAFYISSIQLSSELTKTITNYDIKICGTQVNSENASKVQGDYLSGGIKFTPASSSNNNTNTLTLNDATIDGYIEYKSSAPLIIEFSGVNKVGVQNPGYITSDVTTTLTLKRKGEVSSSLSFSNSSSGLNYSSISGFSNVEILEGVYMQSSEYCRYVANNYKDFYGQLVKYLTFTTVPQYPLWISDIQVNESNYSNVLSDATSSVSYNDTEKTLTLNGATLTNNIVSSSGEPLTIELSKGNTISASIKEVSGAATAPALIFKSTDDTGYVKISPAAGTPAISGYDVGVSSEGLFVDGDYSVNGESVTVAKSYDLQVKGTWVSNANASDVLKNGTNPTVIYDVESNTLTLNGAVINDSQTASADRIINYKGTEDLTIAIKGNTNTAAKIAYSGTGTPNLIFSKAEDGCKLTLERSDDNFNSVIEGFADVQFTNTYFSSAKPYTYDTTNKVLINPTLISNDIYYKLNQVIVTSTVCYKLWVSTTQVTEENATNVLGNSTATFTAPSTLNLSGVSFDNPILSDLDNLEIKISGENSLKASSGTSGYIQSINSNAALTLSKGADNSSLSLGNTIGKPAVSGFKSVTLEDGLYLKSNYLCRYVENDMAYKGSNGTEIQTLTITTEQHYPLWVVDTQVTPANKGHILGDDDETVTFDGTNTLTLNGASISSSSAIESNLDNLVINLKGENFVSTYSTYGYSAICSGKETATLTIVKDPSETGNVTLNLSSGAAVVKGFASVSHEGLYFTSRTGTTLDATNTNDAIISSAKIEPLWIENILMTDATTINGTNGTSGTITYNSTDKILTLNGFQKSYGSGEGQIQTGVEGLTIKIVGDNNINAAGISILFKAIDNSATIKFVGTTADDKLNMTIGSVTNSAFEGFADGAITYENLVYSGGGYGYTIQAPTAPAMTLDTNGKIKLTKDYNDGTIHYSIAYADNTPSEPDVEYSDPFELTHPATVSAWVVANGATTTTVTGKYFAYQDAPYTMAIGSTKTPTLLPTIAENDYVMLSGYASADGTIATFANGQITANAPGTATLSVTLTPGDSTPFIVLNPVSDPQAPDEYAVTFSVYVGENLSNYFEGSNEFGTFYNEDSEIYAVPQGMKAYVVTGVSGSKLVTVETTVLPPNTVVLLDKAEGISFTKVPAEGAAPGGNLLKHATADISVTTESSLYVLYNDTYVKATAGSPIPTGKNYLDLSPTTNAGTRGFYNIIGEDDGSTGISEVKSEGVNSEKWDGEWFDLQGRRLPAQPTKPGLYIHKDKKVVIK